ncbi:MAG: hypothetical protein ACRDM0_17085 [Thermoleophilaceae bacterium]
MPRTWLMATHDGPRTDTEAESVLVEHDGQHVTVTIDDGDEWTFDRMELLQALDAGDAVAVARACTCHADLDAVRALHAPGCPQGPEPARRAA